MKTLLLTGFAIILRVCVRLPVRLTAGLCFGLGVLFEALGNAITRIDELLHPITILPFARKLRAELDSMEDAERRKALKAIKSRVHDV